MNYYALWSGAKQSKSAGQPATPPRAAATQRSHVQLISLSAYLLDPVMARAGELTIHSSLVSCVCFVQRCNVTQN